MQNDPLARSPITPYWLIRFDGAAYRAHPLTAFSAASMSNDPAWRSLIVLGTSADAEAVAGQQNALIRAPGGRRWRGIVAV